MKMSGTVLNSRSLNTVGLSSTVCKIYTHHRAIELKSEFRRSACRPWSYGQQATSHAWAAHPGRSGPLGRPREGEIKGQ